MREFTELTSISQVDAFIAENHLAFLYISHNNCSVCHALLPQVKELMEKFPEIHLGHILTDDVEEIAGRFSVFTVPVLLLFVYGKEYVREARIVHMDLFDEKIRRVYENVTGT
jgi:thiol-disulfide isomerase/thioredoxin